MSDPTHHSNKERAADDRLSDVVVATSVGASLIQDERLRQINVEGWTADHDDQHVNSSLVEAALSYATAAVAQVDGLHSDWWTNASRKWPWGDTAWKPSEDPIRNLAKAGALLAAEIDRLQRRVDSDVG